MIFIPQENAIVPSDSNLFPQCDWLIGNHSDELTPWIPVIAARYFLISHQFHLYIIDFTFLLSNSPSHHQFHLIIMDFTLSSGISHRGFRHRQFHFIIVDFTLSFWFSFSHRGFHLLSSRISPCHCGSYLLIVNFTSFAISPSHHIVNFTFTLSISLSCYQIHLLIINFTLSSWISPYHQGFLIVDFVIVSFTLSSPISLSHFGFHFLIGDFIFSSRISPRYCGSYLLVVNFTSFAISPSHLIGDFTFFPYFPNILSTLLNSFAFCFICFRSHQNCRFFLLPCCP